MATVKTALNGKSLETGATPEKNPSSGKGLFFQRYFTQSLSSSGLKG